MTTTARLDALLRHVAALRPGRPLVPALAGGLMRGIALSLGTPVAGWRTTGGTPVVLAVLDDRIEVWNGVGEQAPRWSVPTRDARVENELVDVAFHSHSGIHVHDGLSRIVVVPRYGRASRSRQTEDLDRALRDLGHDPDTVPGRRGPAAPEVVEPEAPPVWSPDAHRRLLRGASARAVAATGGAVVLIALTAFVVFLVVLFTPLGDGEPDWVFADVAVMLTCALLIGRDGFSPMLWAAARRTEAEYAAGYATTSDAWTARTAPVDVVDPRSKRVVRPAGDPLRYAEEKRQHRLIRQRVRAARAAARGRTPAQDAARAGA